MTPDQIIAAARACLKTPFAHQGRLPGVALDCAGLVVAVARALEIDHLDFPGYGRRPANGQLKAALDAQPELREVSASAILPGDILLMAFEREPQHLAIYAGATLIHSWAAPGEVCEHDFSEIWQRRTIAAYRFVGVVHEQ